MNIFNSEYKSFLGKIPINSPLILELKWRHTNEHMENVIRGVQFVIS